MCSDSIPFFHLVCLSVKIVSCKLLEIGLMQKCAQSCAGYDDDDGNGNNNNHYDITFRDPKFKIQKTQFAWIISNNVIICWTTWTKRIEKATTTKTTTMSQCVKQLDQHFIGFSLNRDKMLCVFASLQITSHPHNSRNLAILIIFRCHFERK